MRFDKEYLINRIMENKINIAELLKDCPKGMELDCTICNNLKFVRLDISSNFPIVVRNNGYEFSLTKYGQVHNIENAECVIFPKGKTTWEGFVPPYKFKNGDILSNGICICIYNGDADDKYYGCYVAVGHLYYPNYFINRPQNNYFTKENARLATEEEKQKLFDAIKANGYNWNAETKTLERLFVPKFKVGDRIRHRTVNFTHRIIDIKDGYYIINEISLPHGLLPIKVQDHYELVPDKFDITTLKPFDRVLVRLTNNCVWIPKLFYYYDTDSKVKYYPFVTTDNIGYVQCIPYKGNEHLCRTTNDCDDFYKTWK